MKVRSGLIRMRDTLNPYLLHTGIVSTTCQAVGYLLIRGQDALHLGNSGKTEDGCTLDTVEYATEREGRTRRDLLQEG